MVEFDYDGNVFEVRNDRCYRLLNSVARIIFDEGDFHENYMDFCKGEAHDIYHGEETTCPNLEAVEPYMRHCFFSTSIFSNCDDNPYSIEQFISLAETFERARVDGMMAGL